MGNTSSSTKTPETRVDHGYLTPHGIYTGPIDWNQHIVGHLILERRLAPFYRPLEDYDESWDDETILANRKGVDAEGDASAAAQEQQQQQYSSRHGKSHQQRPGIKEVQKPTEAQIYRGAVECPICFMFYPPNINHSRCCFQAICSECFVQIKRNEPTPTHLVSEPACCPYCQQESFGVTYTPPPWRTGLVSDNARPEMSKGSSSAPDPGRRKSFSHDSPNVVTTDQIRPDWEERLAAVKAAVARRANRRIIMRQVGDRLIPVGVTSSRTQLPEGITTVEDIEELMLMEAMRLSLLDQERSAGNASTSAATPFPAVPSRLGTSNPPTPSPGSSPRPSDAATDEAQRRRAGNPTVSALAVPLANASNLIAMSTAGMPSSSRDNVTPERPSAPDASLSVEGGSSAISSLRERLSSQSSSHRRADSNPPPTTTLAAAISANSMANAFLHPRSSEAPTAAASTTNGSGEHSGISTDSAAGSGSGSGLTSEAPVSETRVPAAAGASERKDEASADTSAQNSAMAH